MEIKNMKKITILLLVTILSLSLISCAAPEEDSEPIESVEEAIVIKDHLNREVILEKPAETLITSYYIPTSIALSLDLKDNLVGIEAKADKRPIYEMVAPELLDLPSVGTMKEFDLEGAVELDPDLIVMSVRLEDAVNSMEDLGVNVIAIDPENSELLEESINMIAKATGREAEAKKLIDYNKEKMEMIEELIEGKDKKDVYLGGNSSFLSTASNKMYQHDLIENAGGNNVAGDIDDTYWADISYEQLIAYNPEYIIGIPGATYTKADIIEDERLQDIKAVKNEKVYFMPSDIENWDSPVPSGILGNLWLTSVLHEDLYSFDEFQDDAIEFYNEFYNLDLDRDKITK